MDEDSLSATICYPNQLLWSSNIDRNLHIHNYAVILILKL